MAASAHGCCSRPSSRRYAPIATSPPRSTGTRLAQFLRFGWLPGPRSIYRGVLKLPAGTLLVLGADDEALPEPQPYWSARTIAERLAADPFTGSLDDAATMLEELLTDSVRRRMVADVPLGALLSGGIDSALVVALMQRLGSQPVRTFTIGFREPKWDEAPAARAMAEHLGTAHTELYVTGDDALEVIPDLPRIYDEPFADPSQLPTTLVCRLAGSTVTVALSGDGGDEPFGGYGRYRRVRDRWARLSAWPRAPRCALAMVRDWLPAESKLARRLAGVEAAGLLEVYAQERSRSEAPFRLVPGARHLPDLVDLPDRWPQGADPSQIMMFLDLAGYLPDNNLVKVDRASMSVGLEIRSPLLDHRVVELAFRLPLAMRLGQDRGKLVLWRLLERHVPRALFERPKQGFGVPVGAWLRGPLRGWAEGLLDERRLREEGLLDAGSVQALWAQHRGAGAQSIPAALASADVSGVARVLADFEPRAREPDWRPRPSGSAPLRRPGDGHEDADRWLAGLDEVVGAFGCGERSSSLPILAHRRSTVRSAALRRSTLSLAIACSIGLRSGE